MTILEIGMAISGQEIKSLRQAASLPTLSQKNAKRMGHPSVLVGRERSIDVHPR